jgi:hypothetical protein
MDSFSKLLGRSSNSTSAARVTDVEGALARLRTWLGSGANPVLRLFVDSGGGRGNQVAGVRVLDRVVAPAAAKMPGLAYTGPGKAVDIVYEDKVAATVVVLRELLGWAPDQDTGMYPAQGGVQCRLVPYSKAGTLPLVNLGLSGASDNTNPDWNMADAIKVSYCLRLQPFGWPKPEELYAPGRRTPLTDVASLGGPAFKQRAYYLPTPSIDWAPYVGSSNPTIALRAQALKYTLDRMYDPTHRPPFALLLTYGIHTTMDSRGSTDKVSAISTSPYDQVTELVLGTMATQYNAGGAVATALPAVIVNLDDFYYDPDVGADPRDRFAPVTDQYLTGGFNAWENRVLSTTTSETTINQARATRAARAKYLQQVGAAGRVAFTVDPSVLQLTNSINWLLTSDAIPSVRKVLWVQLGPVPPQVFNYMVLRSTLPPVFEGVNTANLALNLGKMYYQINSRTREIVYPTNTLAPNPGYDYLRALQDAANTIAVRLDEWPITTTDFSSFPPEVFARPIIAYRSEDVGTGTYHRYFTGLGQFYASCANDKLSLALAYLSGVVTSAEAAPKRAEASPLAADGPLDQLWKSVEANFDEGEKTLALVPGALTTGPIYDFLTGLIVDEYGALKLTNATVARKPDTGDVTEIYVAGTTDVMGPPVAVTAVFTAPEGAVQANVGFAYTTSGSFPGLGWIQMNDPYVELTLSDAGALTYGKAGVDVVVGGGSPIHLSWVYPAPDDAWLVTGTFEKPFPSIAGLFQLAAGVNLVATLPPPLNVLTDLGLAELAVAYDTTTQSASYLSFLLERNSTASLHLVGKVALDDVAVQTTVTSPGSLTDRSISAQLDASFVIGDPTTPDAATIGVTATTPQFTISGRLVSGSLELTDLLTMFLPDVELNLPDQPTITSFSFSYDQAADSVSVDVDLNAKWTFSVGGTAALEVDDLGLTATSVRGATTGTLYGSTILLPGSLKLNLTVSASYVGAGDWVFEAKQQGQADLAALLSEYLGWTTGDTITIEGLDVVMKTADGSWSFSGKTAGHWSPPFMPDLTATAAFAVGYNATGVPPGAPVTDRALVRTSNDAGLKPFARLEVDLAGGGGTGIWEGLDVRLWLEYGEDAQKYGITWGILTGELDHDSTTGDWTAALHLGDGVTLGSLVETLISWATGSKFGLESPWSVLNDISLSGVGLTYTFNSDDPSRNHATLTVGVGPIDLGFARIDSIGISYESSASGRGVMVSLSGSFPWNQEGSGGLGPWDATQPGAAPAPPGGGNKYLDLRLLAMGQHVTAPGLPEATSVEDAIARLAKLPPTDPDTLPAIEFDAASGWIVGADLGILKLGDSSGTADGGGGGYFLTTQIVFNDPVLYALRVKLDGEPAKIFKGLDFQIMYRQISPSVGVYQAEITLPDMMRRLDIGAYTVTLPVFGIAVYTNGDFTLDIGFPWNQNFARSFTIEGIIPPGIPVLGSAGFYFGKLSSATSTQVPQSSKGTFNPVIVFGFGLQVGFGKSIEYGPLKAGFSVTLVGILEGVLGKWNPYALPDGGTTDDSQLQTSYYFSLQGTVGIIGKLYGSIDFAVVKADVNVEVQLLVQLTYEAYVSLSISVIASVDVSIAVKIDLGLFSITIHCSFSMRLKETFTLDNSGTAPWADGAPALQGRLRMPAEQRLRVRAPVTALGAEATAPQWSNLQPPPDPQPLAGYLIPGLTVARDEWATTQDPTDQVPAYVLMLMIESVAPPAGDTAPAVAAAGDSDTPFEALAKMVLRWAVASTSDRRMTPAEVDAYVVTADDLARLVDEVLRSTDANPQPIPPDAVTAFLDQQFRFSLSLPPDTGAANTTYFPMPPQLELSIPAYGDAYPGYDYEFGSYDTVTSDGLEAIGKYFAELQVQVEKESGAGAAPVGTRDDGTSLGTWMYADYFLLIARQMVQAARDALRDFKYQIASGDTIAGVLEWVNDHEGLTGAAQYQLNDVVTANQTHPMNAAKDVVVGVTYPIGSNPAVQDTFAGIADAFGVTALDVAGANAATSAVLTQGATIDVGTQSYQVQAGDTLVHIASVLKLSFGAFLAGSDVLTAQGLLAQGQPVLVPVFMYQTQAGGTLTSVGSFYENVFSPADLAAANAGRPVLQAGEKVAHQQAQYVVKAWDTLGDVAAGLGLSFSDLLAQTDVLEQVGLLAPLAPLALPTFTHVTATGETLQGVAARWAAPLSAIGDQPANALTPDLFATSDTTGPSPYLDFPHMTQFPVGDLLAEVQRTGALQHLSGMVGRFHLHGLRLPTADPATKTPWIVPLSPGMWVRESDNALELPPAAGLFALTGQQFPLPVLGEEPFSFTLRRPDDLDWLLFVGAGGEDSDTLTATIDPDSPDAERIASVTACAHEGRFTIKVGSLGPDQMYRSADATFPFPNAVPWQSAGTVTLPYTTAASAVPSLRIWSVPAALSDLPNPATRSIEPRFSLQVARFDEATGGTAWSAATSYGWGTTIDFTVKRIPDPGTAGAGATTYEVVGAGGAAVALLERMVAEIGDDDAFYDALALGFVPDQTGGAASGIETGDVATVTMGISQVNLSTETRPTLDSDVVGGATSGLGLLNAPSDLVRLLWEASITGTGGFYLYYYDSSTAGGLPDRIFNDKGEATVTLVVVYAKAEAAADQDLVTDFMNVVVTGEEIQSGNAVLVARADPASPLPQTPTGPDVTLAGLAFGYFCDVGDLAESNRALELSDSARIVVTEGVFQAPPEGISLAALEQRFATTAADLQAANPQLSPLPDPLPFPVAIHLPSLTLVPGTSPSSATLDEIAAFYGETLTALAAHNSGVAGIWAEDQTVTLPVGPRTRAATAGPGIQSVAASRPRPELPGNPGDDDFATLFLENAYSLLGVQIAENAYFDQSSMGLPAGPTTLPADPANQDKVRAARPAGDVPEWDYSRSFPYASPGTSPYVHVGDILQVHFDWQDYYGNLLVTVLSDPQSGDSPPFDEAPILLGYVDPLVALGQWPMVSSSWTMAGDAHSGATIVVGLTFDPTSMAGLVEASATSATTVDLTFSEAVDPATAQDVQNYHLTGGVSAAQATLTNSTTVELTVSTLPQDESVTLTISGVKSAAGNSTFGGQAGFAFPSDDAARWSTVQRRAAADLLVYQKLQLQLDDPNGVAYEIQSSLFDAATIPGRAVTLDTATVTGMKQWLFDASAGASSITAFLADRAAFGTAVQPPSPTFDVEVALDQDDVTSDEVFEISLAFVIVRTGGVAAGDLETTPGIVAASTSVSPLHDPGDTSTTSLDAFAAAFELALSVPGSYLLKVATGVDRYASTSTTATIWGVRVGLVPGQPISYSVASATSSAPYVFSPRPISNQLQSRPQVAIRDYERGSGISRSPTRHVDFSNIDMDVWGRVLVTAVDDVLSPRYTGAIQIVDSLTAKDYLQQILEAKEKLASSLKFLMIDVFADQSEDATNAQEAFYQQLLVNLSNAYSTRAAVEYQMDVATDTTRKPPPRLFGEVVYSGAWLEAARADPTALSSVTLTFSAGMDPKTASVAGNYTVTDGPDVSQAKVDDDRSLVELTFQADVTPGKTKIEVGPEVTDDAGQPVIQPTSQVVTLGDGLAKTMLTFSPPKLDLVAGASQPLTFLVVAPETVRGASGEVVESVTLHLTYAADTIEHQIGALPNVEGYEASSWLTFVIPDPASPLHVDLGDFMVPMVLRAFPTAPALTTQTGTGTDASAAQLEKITQWDYAFSYSLPFHYPQDTVACTVEFNVEDSVEGDEAIEDAFAQIAEFVTVFPDVLKDFVELLSTIDATLDPTNPDDETKLHDSAVALEAFIWMLDQICSKAGGGPTIAAYRSRLVGDDELTLSFSIEENSIDYETTEAALLVTLTWSSSGTVPATVDIDDYEAIRYVPPGTASDDTASVSFVYQSKDGSGYLTAAAGQAIPERTVTLQDLDVLQRQDAMTTASITRNAELVPGRPTAEPFVYHSATTEFSNPMHPYIDSTSEIDIAGIGVGKPVVRSLEDHLTQLFAVLLEDNVQPQLTFQVEVTYDYPLNPDLVPVPLPVLMQPPLEVVVTGSSEGPTLADMVASWASGIELWFQSHQPEGAGTLKFDVVTMSNLTRHAMPLLRLRCLYLPLACVSPPLA